MKPIQPFNGREELGVVKSQPFLVRGAPGRACVVFWVPIRGLPPGWYSRPAKALSPPRRCLSACPRCGAFGYPVGSCFQRIPFGVFALVGAIFAPCGGESPPLGLSTGGGEGTSVGGTRADM